MIKIVIVGIKEFPVNLNQLAAVVGIVPSDAQETLHRFQLTVGKL